MKGKRGRVSRKEKGVASQHLTFPFIDVMWLPLEKPSL